jgi:hypothetical protein
MWTFRCERCGGVFSSIATDGAAAGAKFRANVSVLTDARFMYKAIAAFARSIPISRNASVADQ